MSLTLKALPGHLVLHFPKPIAERNGIFIPETSQQRPEFGDIVDVGEPLDEKQAKIAEVMLQCQKLGIPLPVRYGSGVSYWFGKENALTESEWSWLKDYRVYSIGEPAAMLVEEEKENG